MVTNSTVEKDKINDLPILRSLWALFLSLIHSLFMSGIVNLTSVQKGEGKYPGKVTTPFKFCGHWRIILLLSLQVNRTWGQKCSSLSLTYLPLVHEYRGSNTCMCWPTSNKNSPSSQGVGNRWVIMTHDPKKGWQVCSEL